MTSQDRPHPSPELSIVIPCFNEADGIEPLLKRLIPVLTGLTPQFEILLVDDGSRDSTRSVIWKNAQKDARIIGIGLARNFGHQAALLAGLERSRGQAVISMDADLQHPPEVIPSLVAEWRAGFKIVQTVRTESKGVGLLKRITSRLFYSLFSRLTNLPLTPGSSDFRLLDRKALQALLSLSESNRFLRGLVFWIGFKRKEIPFIADARTTGASQYTLKKMLKFGVDAVVSFSDKPLYISLAAAILLGCVVFVYSVYVVYQFSVGAVVPGWASSILLTGIVGTAILFGQGLHGIYLARLYREVKRRPIYIVSEESGTSGEHI